MLNQEDIIRMAREAGAKPSHNPELWDIWNIRDTDLERFAALVSAHEREECAKLCDAQKRFDARWNMACLRLSKYIRARGEK
jgi:hypothetical protein